MAGSKLMVVFESDYVTTPEGARDLLARLLRAGNTLPVAMTLFYFIRDVCLRRPVPNFRL